MENNRNNPSRSGDKGKQAMITTEEEKPASSGTKVDLSSGYVRSAQSAFWNWGRPIRFSSSIFFSKNQRSRRDVGQFVARVEEMLQVHHQLLPKYKMIPLFGQGRNPPSRKSIQFVQKVKDHFQGDGRFNFFVSILVAFAIGTKNCQDAYAEMKELFIDNPDLLQEFLTYLPIEVAARISRQ